MKKLYLLLIATIFVACTTQKPIYSYKLAYQRQIPDSLIPKAMIWIENNVISTSKLLNDTAGKHQNSLYNESQSIALLYFGTNMQGLELTEIETKKTLFLPYSKLSKQERKIMTALLKKQIKNK